MLANLLRHFGWVDVLVEQLLEQHQGLLGTHLAEITYKERFDAIDLGLEYASVGFDDTREQYNDRYAYVALCSTRMRRVGNTLCVFP